MSHIVVKLYSFECDADGCREVADVVPIHRAARALDDARSILRSQDGWTIRGGCEFCPKHSERADV